MEKTFLISEYEKMTLGSVISGIIPPEEIIKLKREYLSVSDNIDLYDCMLKVFNQQGNIDYISVLTEYEQLKGFRYAKDYIDMIIGLTPSDFNFQKALDNIERHFIAKKSVEVIDHLKAKVISEPNTAPELLLSAYEIISNLLSTSKKKDFDLINEFKETIDLVVNAKDITLIKTGIKGIDNIIGGISTKEVTIIAGRPGHGKTTFSVQLARSILDNNPNMRVVKFELEMPREQVKRKFLANVSGVSLNKMRSNTLSNDDVDKLNKSLAILEKYKNRLYIYDDIYDLATMNKICREINANVVMVDFVSLMDGIGDDKRNDIADIIINMKKFAKMRNVAYIVFSQLNRGPDNRQDHRPTMSDIAESDQITQLASEIILLYYRYKYSYEESDRNILQVIFDKARYSSIGESNLLFFPEYALISDIKTNEKEKL